MIIKIILIMLIINMKRKTKIITALKYNPSLPLINKNILTVIKIKDTTGMILITPKLSEVLKKVLLPQKTSPESLTQIKTLLKKY